MLINLLNKLKSIEFRRDVLFIIIIFSLTVSAIFFFNLNNQYVELSKAYDQQNIVFNRFQSLLNEARDIEKEYIELSEEYKQQRIEISRLQSLLNESSSQDNVEIKYIYDFTEIDRVWFIYVGYNSLSSDVNHKLIVSTTPDFGNIIYTEWQNYTLKSEYHKNVEFNIPSTVIKPNSRVFYKTQVLNIEHDILAESEVHESIHIVDENSPIYTQLTKSGEERGYDYPWNWGHEVIWDDNTQQFWLLSSGEKEFTKKAWASTKPYDWEYCGNISTDFPEGWTSHKGVSGFIVDNRYFASINIQNDEGTGAALYSGNTFVNMTLEGVLFKYGENENCTVNSRLNDFWYNATDQNWYGLVSGSSIFKGTRTHVYLAQSDDLNFTGDFDEFPLYYSDQWGVMSWPNAGIYPPNTVWMDNRGFAGVKGYANLVRPYDFDSDLIFMESPRNISTDSFLTDLENEDAYFNGVFNVNDTQRSVPVIQDGIVWMMVRTGVGYDAVGFVFSLTGYWANETVRISPGYNPLYHYESLPTKEEFVSMMDVTVYVWKHDANVTLNHVQGEPPVYARMEIEGVVGDEIIIHIKELSREPVYLHVKVEDGVNILKISNVKTGSIQRLVPFPNGDVLFSYFIS